MSGFLHSAGAPVASSPLPRRVTTEVAREQPAGEEGKSPKGEAVLRACAATLGFVALVVLLTFAARHAFGGNSDDATIVLQGQSMAGGHLALKGWALSYDAFWTSDVPFYALAVAILGVGPDLFSLVPAVIAALVVATGIFLVRERRRGPAVLLGICLLAALLALPGPDLAFFFLQGGWHAVTALWCLLVFAGVARAGSRAGLVVAVLLLAAGLLGDLLTVTVGLAPLVAAGVVAAVRERRLRALSRYLLVAGGGLALAAVARSSALAVGSYSIGSRNLLATRAQALANFESLPNRLLALFGVREIVGGLSSSPWPLRLAHLVLFAVVLCAVLFAALDIAWALLGRSARVSAASAVSPSRLDDLLLIAVLCDLASYVFVATDSNVSLARYLIPGVVFAAVLAGRVVTRLALRLPARQSRRLVACAALLLALCALDFGIDSLGATAPQEASVLGPFLQRHGLLRGIGDYWSSSIVTVDSGGSVVVRPVDVAPSGSLVRFSKQSESSWYAAQQFQFFVYDGANEGNKPLTAAVLRAFGAPQQGYSVGTYKVLVWGHPLEVAP